MQSQVGLLLVLGYLATGVLSCGPCTCSGTSKWSELANMQVAKCSDVKNLTSVPCTLPEHVQGLDIEYCPGITTLKQNEFASFKNLQVIYVRLGNLRSIESHAFRGMTNVKIISLDNNKLTDLATDIFTDTPNLFKLYLYTNKLQILRKNLFANLQHLEYVDLSHNKITLIESHTFVNVPILESLLIKDNQLTTVYINGEFVGGCDIMLQIHQSGDLNEELEKAGIKSALIGTKEVENTKE